MKILIVVVLYEKLISVSDTIISLNKNNLTNNENYSLLVFDNSFKKSSESLKNLDYDYFHANQNKGVLGAYKHAIIKANKEHFDWILMLDDDTTLPKDFLFKSLRYFCFSSKNI